MVELDPWSQPEAVCQIIRSMKILIEKLRLTKGNPGQGKQGLCKEHAMVGNQRPRRRLDVLDIFSQGGVLEHHGERLLLPKTQKIENISLPAGKLFYTSMSFFYHVYQRDLCSPWLVSAQIKHLR
jgi:hypothetical protein